MKNLIFALALFTGACCWAQGESGSPVDDTTITVTPLNDHLYMITCIGGEEFNMPPYGTNLIASVGPDGILLVDAAFTTTAEALRDTLKTLGNGNLKLVINTHHHGDHTLGNQFLKNQATVIAHRNVIERMTGDYFSLPGAPDPNQPAVGFDDSLIIVFNGEKIRVVHTPNCHSDGDAYVHFTGSNIVAAGDLFFSDEIPFVHLQAGGTVKEYRAQLKKLINEFPDATVFVASHGRTYTKDHLQEYDRMLSGTVSAVEQAVAKGLSLEELDGDTLLADWAEWNGSFPTTTLQAWTQTVFTEASGGSNGKPSISEPLTAVLLLGSAREAAQEYERLKATEVGAYDFGEVHLNMLGYQLLMRGRTEDAIGIFRLNIDAFPTSFNVYDSYAEALAARGDTAQAIENYEKSLELNPENTNAVEMLKKLRQP
ncbi:MAG: MBL fold metallo-hydrolase [Candidatus Zixiibacteriota bacterium]|nr:MAG: MBL fold metallo-hydrolase [candidate division Zixibacteria bacterium]